VNRVATALSEHPRLAGVVSPRHRRWWKILSSLDIDPDRLPRPVVAPGPRDFIICGIPRSGTSLLCAALYQPPACVTVMEPWDGLRLPPAELFASLRSELGRGELTRGRLDVEGLLANGEVRWGSDGEFPHRVGTTPDPLVGVKWPVFWRYLDLLPDTRFLVCVRNPVDVVASFTAMKGRLSEGLHYDVPFNRAMNEALRGATDDPATRRALLFEYIASRIVPHLGRPNVLLVRYERWFQDRGGLMREIAGFLDTSLGPGEPVIREPAHRSPDPGTARLVAEHCPSASGLGYPVATADRSVGPPR
jgi:hypothetical protein